VTKHMAKTFVMVGAVLVGAVAAESAKVGTPGEPAAKAARAVAEAEDIKAARAAFAPLSEAVIALVKADPSAHDVKLAYCSMAKASWLQKEEKIRNPYYGPSMLSCGEFRPIEKQ
jgi:membrane fusion protein, copper/silver efflux system